LRKRSAVEDAGVEADNADDDATAASLALLPMVSCACLNVDFDQSD
jgi:hypothetical protein